MFGLWCACPRAERREAKWSTSWSIALHTHRHEVIPAENEELNPEDKEGFGNETAGDLMHHSKSMVAGETIAT